MRILPWLLACPLCVTAFAEEPKAPTVSPETPVAKPAAPTEAEVIASFNKEDSHVRIDTQNRWLEFDAKVCLRDAEMLEVLICTPMTREHESVMVSQAKPSRIHLGLLLLGLEAGAPRSVRWVGPQGDEPQIIPASGPEVELFLVYKKKTVENGKPVEKEVEERAASWLVDAKTRKESTNNRWLFTGSRMGKTLDDRPCYVADGEGNIASIVNFGDETLAPHNQKTKENDSPGEDLVCNTRVIPEIGTQVVVRVKPVKQVPATKKAVDKPPAP